MSEKFWMVYVEQRNGLTVYLRFGSLEVAKAEAERLCRHEGVPAFVLEAVRVVRQAEVKPPLEWKAL